MSNGAVGITFTETMTGNFALGETEPKAGEAAGKKAGTTLALHATIEIDDLDRFVADPSHSGHISGHIDFAPLGMNLPGDRGVFRLFSPTDQKGLSLMIYELAFSKEGQPYYLAGQKEVENDKKGADLFSDTTTLLTRVHKGADAKAPVVGAGVLTLGLADLTKMTSTMRVLNAKNPGDYIKALATFIKFFMGNLWDTYGLKPKT
jgi:choline dehydrogenase-like flavoprotein